ncbi:uncharacterized protein [Periplaneta americana]|uniref:uncharacterized protein n=1 Tax=Periplaneta americana TaxID=6978 RepID=UPI0037E80070
MENNERKFDVTRLMAVLEETLETTTKVNNILYSSCNEVQDLLNNWVVPDESTGDEIIQCTCANDEDCKMDEVAKNIEEVVGQAQKLRQTFSTKPRFHSNNPITTRKPNVEKLFSKQSDTSTRIPSASNGLSSSRKVNTVRKKTESILHPSKKQVTNNNETSTVTKATNTNNQSTTKRSSVDNHITRITTCTVTRTSSVPLVNDRNDKKVKRPYSSPSNFQTTYQRDFPVRKNISKHNNTSNSSSKLQNSTMKDDTNTLRSQDAKSLGDKDLELHSNKLGQTITSPSGKIRISELEKLLSVVTIYPNPVNSESIKLNTAQVKTNSCALHGGKAANVKKDTRVVGLAEALDILGIPPELVKGLKTYHAFLASNGSNTLKCNESKSEAANSFLHKLETTNESSLNNVCSEPLVQLFSEYLATFAKASKITNARELGMNNETVVSLLTKFEDLEKKYRILCNVEESVISEPKTSKCNSVVSSECHVKDKSADGWAIIGVWNTKSRRRFKALETTQYIRYKSGDQWKKFAANLQKIQRTELQIEIYDLIQSFILPQLTCLDPQDPAFLLMFKAVCSLCDMSLLPPPVIIKSN